MSGVSPPRDHPFVLLVEGRDDTFAIANLLERHGCSWPGTPWFPRIRAAEGVSALLEAISVSLKTRCSRLAVVIDADLDAPARWDEVRGRFARLGVRFDRAIGTGGAVARRSAEWSADVGPDRVGAWLMPDHAGPGGLETFLSRLVPDDDAVWSHAVTATAGARARGAPVTATHVAKAELHAWLAWQSPPGLPFGTALNARVLRHDSPLAAAFVGWIRAVFG